MEIMETWCVTVMAYFGEMPIWKGTSYLDDSDFSIPIRCPPFQGRLSVLGWTAFRMSSTTSEFSNDFIFLAW